MHGTENCDSETDLLEELATSSRNAKSDQDGGIELFQDGEIYCLRNRQESSLKMVAINGEAIHEENNQRISNEIRMRGNENSKFHNNNQFINLGESLLSHNYHEKKLEVHGGHSIRGTSIHSNKDKEYNRESEQDETGTTEDGCNGFGGMFHVCAGQKRLLHVKEMPDHLQFNAVITNLWLLIWPSNMFFNLHFLFSSMSTLGIVICRAPGIASWAYFISTMKRSTSLHIVRFK